MHGLPKLYVRFTFTSPPGWLFSSLFRPTTCLVIMILVPAQIRGQIMPAYNVITEFGLVMPLGLGLLSWYFIQTCKSNLLLGRRKKNVCHSWNENTDTWEAGEIQCLLLQRNWKKLTRYAAQSSVLRSECTWTVVVGTETISTILPLIALCLNSLRRHVFPDPLIDTCLV